MFTGYDTRLVRTPEEWEEVRPRFEAAPLLALDFETTSLEDRKVWGMPMALPRVGSVNGLAVYFGCETWMGDCTLSFPDHLAPWLEGLFHDDEREWVGHNLKFDLNVLRRAGFRKLPLNIRDTMIASWLLHNDERRHSLDFVAERVLHFSIPKDLMEIRNLAVSDRELYWLQMLRYGVGDGVVPLKLWWKFRQQLERAGILDAALELEFPMVAVTAEMEERGVRVDTDYLAKLGAEYETFVADAEKDVHRAVGREFNIGSPKQLSEVLFDDPTGVCLTPHPWMERGKGRVKKDGTLVQGAWPTGVEVMKSYEHEVCKLILAYRGKSKILGTYIEPFLEQARKDPQQRIRANWNQTGTATGRYSSSDPNMQNLPRQKGTIRRALIAEPGFKLVTCDYSQIELRLMAHMSGDATMCAIYAAGLDIHRRTAAQALGKPEDEVSKGDRNMAKAINFGYLYGMSAARFMDYAWLSYGVRVTSEQADAFRARFFEAYPGVVDYHDYMREFVAEHGYALNIGNERRYLPTYNSTDNYERWKAWSEGVNYTIQGSAAFLIKVAMLNISRALKRPFGERVSRRYGRILTLWGSETNLAHEVRLVMQVHDELVYEVREEIAEPFAKWLQSMMEQAVTGFRVPIVAEYAIGGNLEECKG